MNESSLSDCTSSTLHTVYAPIQQPCTMERTCRTHWHKGHPVCMCIVYESINICALPREEKLVFCKKKKNVWKQELVIRIEYTLLLAG